MSLLTIICPFQSSSKILIPFHFRETISKQNCFPLKILCFNRTLHEIWAQEDKSSSYADPLKCRDCAFAGSFQYMEPLSANKQPHLWCHDQSTLSPSWYGTSWQLMKCVWLWIAIVEHLCCKSMAWCFTHKQAEKLQRI